MADWLGRAGDIVTARTTGGTGVIVALVHWPGQLGILAPRERNMARVPEPAACIILTPRFNLPDRVPDSLKPGL